MTSSILKIDSVYLINTVLPPKNTKIYKVVKVIHDSNLFYEVIRGKFQIERCYMDFEGNKEMLEKDGFAAMEIGYMKLRPHTSKDSFWKQLFIELGLTFNSSGGYMATGSMLYLLTGVRQPSK